MIKPVIKKNPFQPLADTVIFVLCGTVVWFFLRPRLIVAFLAMAIVLAICFVLPILLPKRAKRRKSLIGYIVLLRLRFVKNRARIQGLALGILFGAWLLVPIIFVIALLFIILLLAIILSLIPIRYQVRGCVGGNTAFNTKVSYLFGLVRFVVEYKEGKMHNALYIGWFNALKKQEDKHECEQSNSINSGEADREGTQKIDAKISGMLESFGVEIPPDASSHEDIVFTEKPTSFRDKIKNLKEKIKDIKNRKDQLLTYPNRKFIMKETWKTVKKIFKAILPKKIDVTGTVGFADPSTTGFFFAAYGVIISTFGLGGKVNISCLFDTPETVIALNGHIKGSFTIAKITLPMIRLILKGEIRTLIKDILNLRRT